MARSTYLTLMGVIVAAVAWGGRAAVAEESLPTAEFLLEKYIEVTGGRDAWEAIHSHIVEGAVEAVGTGLLGRRVEYAAEPNKRHVIIDTDKVGRFEEGTDGWIAWARNPMEVTPRVLTDLTEVETIRRATFNAHLHWKDLYEKVECVGVETIDETECYKVVKTPSMGLPETAYFDKSTHLMIKQVTKVQSGSREIPTEIHYSDYKYVGDLLIPHTVLYRFQGNRQKITLETVLHNVPLPDERFEPPADVKKRMAELQNPETQPTAPKTVSVPVRSGATEKARDPD